MDAYELNKILNRRDSGSGWVYLPLVALVVGAMLLVPLLAWMAALSYFFSVTSNWLTAFKLIGIAAVGMCFIGTRKMLVPGMAQRIKDAGFKGSMLLLPFRALFLMVAFNLAFGLSYSGETYGKIILSLLGMTVIAGTIVSVIAMLAIWAKLKS